MSSGETELLKSYVDLFVLIFRLSHSFQTNSIQAERLYNLISEWAGEEIGKTLDLYCGMGSISLHLANRAEQVLGIEVVEEAVEDARLNAERNGVKTVCLSQERPKMNFFHCEMKTLTWWLLIHLGQAFTKIC